MGPSKIVALSLLAALVAFGCKSSGGGGGSEDDTTLPTPGAAVSFSGISATSVTVSWGAGSDDTTPASGLQYLLVRAPASAQIDSVPEAKAATVEMGWTANALSFSISGLSPSTTYWFAVLVQDAAGNVNIYAPTSIATTANPDTTAPTIGAGLAFSGISATGATATWGAASDDITAAGSLRYRLVKASTQAAIDTIAEANAIVGADLAMDWTAGITTKSATGLSPSTGYWFAALVRDAAGNMSLYAPQSVTTTATADTTPPAVGTAIAASGTAATSTNLSWGAATDIVTPQASIQYKLVKASASSAIDTVAKANAIAGADILVDWTAAATSKAVTGLSPSTTYWFAVLARDAIENTSIYAPVSVTTLADTTPPIIGGTIGISGATASSADISWNAGTDDVTAQASLQYKLVKASSSGAIDTAAEANAIAGADLVMDWTANALGKSATGLSDGTSYWFAVLVKDAANNTALYAPQSVTTPDATAPTIGTGIGFSAASATGVTVSWGAASDNLTAQAGLQYKLVKASASSAINSVAKVNAISGADLVMDWTANTISKAVSGLVPITTYYFAVLVRDAATNTSLYAPQSFTTAADTTAPSVGTTIAFSGTSSTGTTVSWGAATDNVTAQASIQYKLVKATTSGAIDTIAEIDAITGADLVMTWTTAATSKAATGLSPTTTYYFAALARDAAGNESLYAPQSVATSADTTAPTTGTAIAFSSTAYTSTTVSWGAASDDITAQASLRYKLVMASASTSIDTVAKANAIVSGTGLVMDWTNNTLTKSAAGLSDGTTYYFAAIVQDAAGNMSLYAPASVTTPASADTTAPTTGTGIVFSGTSMTGTTASWGAASDNVTATASLQYRLVKATTSTAIDTVAEAESISGGDLVMDWSTAAISKAVTGLSQATTYYFAAIVKDAAGNMSLYAPQSVTTSSDTTAPTTGTGVVFSGTSASATVVSWGIGSDNVTAQSSLQYKLVYSSATAFINTVAKANAATIENGGISMDWTSNATTKAVTGLTSSTQYAFGVILRDGAGNMSLYTPQYVTTTAAPDTTAPTAGTGIAFSGVSSNSATVSWGAGTDDTTAQSSLQYKLVKASTQGAIDTFAEVNAVSGADLVMDWTVATTSKTITGLTQSTTYYFAALVKDATGNASLYSPQSVTTTATPDTTAPTTGMGIAFTSTSSAGTTVSWGAASDNITPAASLQYKLVRGSAAGAIDTCAEANAITDSNLIMDWTANATSKAASGLSAGATYWFSVLVKDGAGNMSLYTPQSVTTSTLGNLVYDLNTNPGWTCTGDWQWGTASVVGPVGSVCYGTVINGNYHDYLAWATDYVQAGPLNFSSFATAAGFRMTFQAWFDFDWSWDYACLQYSQDGTTFTNIPAAYVSGFLYCPNNSGADPLCWSPNTATYPPAWYTVQIDLGGLGLNGKSTVWFRWALSSDDVTNGAGYYIDNVNIGY